MAHARLATADLASRSDDQPTVMLYPVSDDSDPDSVTGVELANQPALLPPRRLGRYLVLQRIARGGMASVHLGSTVSLGRRRMVAIKFLDPRNAFHSNALAMFIREARLGARVRHLNVVQTLDLVVDLARDAMALVTEYVPGPTLAKLAQRAERANRQLPLSVIAGIMSGALTGLHAVHEATGRDGAPLGIVHRDVSLRNIVVGLDGHARLIDFGIACIGGAQPNPDDAGLRGTPPYMAPEHIQHKPVDRRADVFSAAVVLWQLLTGRRLFQGTSAGMVWSNILHGQIPLPSQLNPQVSSALDTVVLRALERDRDFRFPTALAFADAIRAATPVATASVIASWAENLGRRDARKIRRTAKVATGARRLQLRNTVAALALLALFAGGVARLACGIGLPSRTASAPAPADPQPAPPAEPQASAVPSPQVEPLPPPDVKPLPDLAPPEPRPLPPPPTPIKAARPSAAQIAALNHRAERAARAGNFAEARRLLGSALVTAADAKLAGDPQTALTHAQLAVVLVKGYGQESLAAKHFRMALLVPRFSPAPSLLEGAAVLRAYRSAVASLQPAP